MAKCITDNCRGLQNPRLARQGEAKCKPCRDMEVNGASSVIVYPKIATCSECGGCPVVRVSINPLKDYCSDHLRKYGTEYPKALDIFNAFYSQVCKDVADLEDEEDEEDENNEE